MATENRRNQSLSIEWAPRKSAGPGSFGSGSALGGPIRRSLIHITNFISEYPFQLIGFLLLAATVLPLLIFGASQLGKQVAESKEPAERQVSSSPAKKDPSLATRRKRRTKSESSSSPGMPILLEDPAVSLIRRIINGDYGAPDEIATGRFLEELDLNVRLLDRVDTTRLHPVRRGEGWTNIEAPYLPEVPEAQVGGEVPEGKAQMRMVIEAGAWKMASLKIEAPEKSGGKNR